MNYNIELIVHASKGNMPDVLKILNSGTSINFQDDQGMTALMAASWSGKTEMIEMLLRRGAEPNLADGYGRTALVLAIAAGQADAVKLLVDHGADPFIEDKSGKNSYDLAIQSGQKIIASILPDKDMLNLLRHGKDSLTRLHGRITDQRKKVSS